MREHEAVIRDAMKSGQSAFSVAWTWAIARRTHKSLKKCEMWLNRQHGGGNLFRVIPSPVNVNSVTVIGPERFGSFGRDFIHHYLCGHAAARQTVGHDENL